MRRSCDAKTSAINHRRSAANFAQFCASQRHIQHTPALTLSVPHHRHACDPALRALGLHPRLPAAAVAPVPRRAAAPLRPAAAVGARRGDDGRGRRRRGGARRAGPGPPGALRRHEARRLLGGAGLQPVRPRAHGDARSQSEVRLGWRTGHLRHLARRRGRRDHQGAWHSRTGRRRQRGRDAAFGLKYTESLGVGRATPSLSLVL